MAETIIGFLASCQDENTKGVKTIDTDHVYIHKGQYFSYSEYKSMATGTTHTIAFKTPANNYDIHMRATIISCSSDNLRMLIYEGCTYSGGSTGTPINHNRKVTTVTKMQDFKQGVTLSENGTLLLPVYLAGAVGVGQTRSGSGTSTQYEWLLKQNTNYAIHFINGSSGTNINNFTINWYEENEID